MLCRCRVTAEDMDYDSDLDQSVYQPLAEGEGYVSTQSKPKWCSIMVAVAFVLGIATTASIAWIEMPESVRAQKHTCKRTEIYPSTSGCPPAAACRRSRLGLQPSARLSRAEVGWRFALPAENEAEVVDGMPHRIHQAFMKLEDRLQRDVSALAHDAHVVHTHEQREITVPLAHFCCLSDAELPHLRAAVNSWVTRRTFDVRLELTHAECWRERHDAVRNALVGDNTSQLHLQRLNEALTAAVHDAGVRIHVSHAEQMKFHVPLTGFHSAGNSSIEPLLDGISRSIDDINRNIDLNLHITKKPSVWDASEL